MPSALDPTPIGPVQHWPATGGQPINATLHEAARTFVASMIHRNLAMLEYIACGASVGYPAGYVMNRFGPIYAEHRVDELSFSVDEEANRVLVNSGKRRVGDPLRFKRCGGGFFFSHFERY
ncbi:MAG: hypothetical protein P8076_12010 [Gammaproteobacteria bacterium]